MDFFVIQYADDTIVIMPADTVQFIRMKDILDTYAQSTGLHINYHKSVMIPINTSNQTATDFAGFFGCIVGSMPFTYLGLPLGTTKPTVYDLMPLVDRIERAMTAKFLMMSYSGRVTVINTLLTSIATFTMCALKVPPKILEHIDKIRRHCLWNKKKEDGEHYNSLIARDKVCRPKNKGGMGVLNLKIQNEGLLLKHLHKFYNKLDTPWVSLVWQTYYTDKVPHSTDLCGSFWWRDICKLSPIYRGISKCTIGSWDTILFRKDPWKDVPAYESYPRAFSFSLDEDVSARDFLAAGTLGANFSLPLSVQAIAELRIAQ